MQNIIDEIDDIVLNSKEQISIIVKDIFLNKYIYKYNSETKFVCASLIKVPILIYVLDLVEKKKIDLDLKILVDNENILDDTEVFERGSKYYSIEELLNWMIINSDNTATNIIINYFGIQNIQHYIENDLNLKSTLLQRRMLDETAIKNGLNNYTNQDDMEKIFVELYNKRILNSELCDKAIQILAEQRHQKQILRYIYEPICYIHKTGALEGLNNDCGIMIVNNKAYYVGVSIWNCLNSNNRKLAGELGKLILTYLKNI